MRVRYLGSVLASTCEHVCSTRFRFACSSSLSLGKSVAEGCLLRKNEFQSLASLLRRLVLANRVDVFAIFDESSSIMLHVVDCVKEQLVVERGRLFIL